jgi:hypothetical protein
VQPTASRYTYLDGGRKALLGGFSLVSSHDHEVIQRLGLPVQQPCSVNGSVLRNGELAVGIARTYAVHYSSVVACNKTTKQTYTAKCSHILRVASRQRHIYHTTAIKRQGNKGNCITRAFFSLHRIFHWGKGVPDDAVINPDNTASNDWIKRGTHVLELSPQAI